MKQIIDILQKSNTGALSTSFNNEPYVRPQHVHFIENNTFYFTTANTKSAFKQLKENPVIEFMVTTDKFETVRLHGKIKFAETVEIKQKVLDNAPLVQKGYKTADNPIYEVFYMESGTITFSDFSGNPPRVIKF